MWALVAQAERLGSMRCRASRMPRGREWPRVRVPRDGLLQNQRYKKYEHKLTQSHYLST